MPAAGIACLLGGLLACVGSARPPDRFFRLEVGDPSARFESPRLPGVLRVGRLRADAIMEGREIRYRPSRTSSEIRGHPYHRWADPPTSMLQVQLARYLRGANAADTVTTPELRVTPDYELSGRVVRFERLLDPDGAWVVVELELDLARTDPRDLLLFETYRQERRAAGPGMADSVAAFQEAVTAVFSQFLASLDDL